MDEESETASKLVGAASQVTRMILRSGQDANRTVGIGLDFGTSNSAAAIFDGHQVHVVQLEASKPVMPSACYIDTQFAVATGEQAIFRYIEENRGRRVEFSAEVLGEARVSTGQVDTQSGLPTAADTSLVYGEERVDAGMPGRLFFGTKRLLGSSTNQRISVFGKPFRLVALITPVLKTIHEMTEAASATLAIPKDEMSHGCLGHPVDFEGSGSAHNRIAMSRLCEAWGHAGIVEQRLCPEPIAAAVSYLQKNPAERAFRALTVDFGGGTLDLCIVHKQGAAIEVEAVHGIALGGDRIDQAIFRELLFPLLGKGELWRRTVDGRDIETEFPFWLYEERLLNWQVSYTLNQNRFTTPVLDQIAFGGERRRKFLRLYDLITNNAVFEVFQAIKAAKESLSSAEEAVIDIPEIDLAVRLSRARFEAIIDGLIDEFRQAVDDTLTVAGLAADNIAVVIRTGGSALIPAFTRALDARFPGKVVEHDPFTGVAAGLAIADYYGFGSDAGDGASRRHPVSRADRRD